MDDSKFADLIEFENSIEMGLDIVFLLRGKEYNISWEANKPFICVCPDGPVDVFDHTRELLENYKVDGEPLENLWEEIVIEFM